MLPIPARLAGQQSPAFTCLWPLALSGHAPGFYVDAKNPKLMPSGLYKKHITNEPCP